MSRSRLAGAAALALVLSVICVLLGLWQLQRTRDILDAEQAAASAPIPVLEAASVDDFPPGSVGRPVTAAGSYVEGQQLLVPNRSLEGRAGVWVVTALRVGDAVVPVLRGWLPSASSPGLAIPAGPVTVAGVLQPYDAFYAGQSATADGQIPSIARPAIEGAWGGPALAAVLVLADQQPAPPPAPAPVPATVQTGNVPFPLQNAAYTLQWFVFAGIVWVMFALWVRSERRLAAQPTPPADSLGA